MENNMQKFMDLRAKVMHKEQILNKLKLPSTRHSQIGLRMGLIGRAQRKEERRFLIKVKKQKELYVKQKAAIDKYLNKIGSIPAPKIKLLETPKLKRARSRARRKLKRRGNR